MSRVIDLKNLGQYVDVSTVKADCALDEVNEMLRIIKQYHCICAAPMPWNMEYCIKELEGTDAVVTAVVGFPAGAVTTDTKVYETKKYLAAGCKEVDMVWNLAAFKSGLYDYVKDDIKAVVDAAEGTPVKSILEIAYLTDDEIKRGAELMVSAGVACVKTGTGWGPKPTTVDTIKLIKSTIGDAAYIKAAGGVRDLETVKAMYAEGCSRFGLGVRTAETILKAALAEA